MNRTRLFLSVFRRVFVYNIVFEDSEVDQKILGLDEDSSVLTITGAGCGVAGMVAKRPRRIDAVDINRHHLALTALKVEGARKLGSYADFYDLFGRGYTTTPAKMVRSLTTDLPAWMQRYWKLHHRRFHEPYYRQGASGQMLAMLRKVAGLGTEWLRQLIALPLAERAALIEDTFRPALNRPYIKAFLHSPLHDVSAGINQAQRVRMLEGGAGESLIDFYVKHSQRVACQTDLERNWIAWYAIAGHFNHDCPDALPPYLRRERHKESQGAKLEVNYHANNMLEVLERAPAKSWSHYILSDAPDWMPEPMQTRLLGEIARTARPGATILRRSVEQDDMVERLGFGRRLVRQAEPSDFATQADRSCQYRRIDLYRMAS